MDDDNEMWLTVSGTGNTQLLGSHIAETMASELDSLAGQGRARLNKVFERIAYAQKNIPSGLEIRVFFFFFLILIYFVSRMRNRRLKRLGCRDFLVVFVLVVVCARVVQVVTATLLFLCNGVFGWCEIVLVLCIVDVVFFISYLFVFPCC